MQNCTLFSFTGNKMCKTYDVKTHYDLMIDEGNDPFFDPKPLKNYMDKWDGKMFFDEIGDMMEKDVLEIGVGTGRLASKIIGRCRYFCGIDLSEKTAERARENLGSAADVITDDFLTYNFDRGFDVVYSSLTFMHFKNKRAAMDKVFDLLKSRGKFVLSIDKSRNEYIDMGSRKVKIYPDSPEVICSIAENCGLLTLKVQEIEFAHIITTAKR